jgi:hypothetical protein
LSLRPEEGFLGLYVNEIKRLKDENNELRLSQKNFETAEKNLDLEWKKMKGEVRVIYVDILFLFKRWS